MKSGYGRGYYGEGQLTQEPPRKRNWFTVVVVLGVGAAAVWFLWPRNKAVPNFDPIKEPLLPPPVHTFSAPATIDTTAQLVAAAQPVQLAQLPAPQPVAALPPAPPTGAFLKQLEDDARSRHFLTVKDYEDSVIKSAKQLQAAGAKVMLAPHLQHLASRLES